MSSKLNRIVQMDGLIRGGGYPSVTLFTERFNVRERTVYDDIDYFRSTLQAPLKYSRAQGGYYYNDLTYMLPTILATEGELLVFFLSAELAQRYLGTGFEQPLRSAIAKLSLNLPEKLQLDLGQLTQHFTFQAGATASADPLLLVALSEAMSECWPIEITYFTASSGERNVRVVEPYHFLNVRGDWQIVAYDHLRQQFRQFAVTRIEAWTLLKHEHFARDPNFSSTTYLASSFLAERGDTSVDVAIWFDAYQARYMRGRQHHPTQHVEDHADGSMTLRFQTGALAEVRRWVMSFGSHARALAPAELVADVAAELTATMHFYTEIARNTE